MSARYVSQKTVFTYRVLKINIFCYEIKIGVFWYIIQTSGKQTRYTKTLKP